MQLCFYNGAKSAEYKTAFKILGYSADDLRIRFIIDKDCLASYFVKWALSRINEDFPVDAYAADNVVFAIDYLRDEDTAESVKGKFTAYFTAEINDSVFVQVPVALTEKEENAFAIAAAFAIVAVFIDNNHDFTGRFILALIVPVTFFVFAIFADVEEIKKNKANATARQAESYTVIPRNKEEETGVITPDWFVICDDEKMYKYNTADVDIWIMRDGKYQPFQRVKPIEVFDLANNTVNADYNPVE